MEQGRRGEWLFRLAHTSEPPGPGALIFTFYLLLGKLAGLLNFSNVVLFHLTRMLTGLLLLGVSYWFISLLLGRLEQRRWAFLLICFSAGFGWLLAPLGQLPNDFWVIESYTFLTIFAAPHFPLITALLFLTLGLSMLGVEQANASCFRAAALSSLLTGFLHPFLLLVMAAVLGLYWTWLSLERRKPDWRGFAGLFGVGLAGLTGAGLVWWSVNSDPLLSQWLRQNENITLEPLATVIGYGLLIPLGLAGLWWFFQRSGLEPDTPDPRLNRWRLAVVWVAVTPVLLALPVAFSWRLVEGMHLPLCCLAAVGWYEVIAPALARRWRVPLQQLLTVILSLTSLMVTLLSVSFIFVKPTDLAEPVRSPYLDRGEQGAIEWLRRQAVPYEVVLTGPLLGNVLPGRAPVRTFYGHTKETINHELKYRLLEQFYNPATSAPERERIIREWNLKYLLHGWRERRLGGFDPAGAGWPLLYDRDGVQLYLLQ